jgi:hypothetical protein
MSNANARSNDYFSFMAEKTSGETPQPNTFTDSDVIEFIEETQIEVTESVISDTMIQRVFGHFRKNLPVVLED